ncbi:uncharacterized protein BP5553_05072 [Venustampulla echinocandica]|uniref:C2H2-type domain-containing protein n=1 Tax=Venustampulla echinocandica TaxID=2656787 RepID=A0A370TQ36_9HELO|nr:uncharacterized protein BP5553_05072 [Venustampulla echinocandica]RDL37639.1 hypothetical protein BP5553_05072 [Venustampulla echinocandica]
MSSPSNYHRNGAHSRSFYPSLASISSADSGQIYGSTREMGPPPLDFPPQPVEIDLNSFTRTLPSPSTAGSNHWDPMFQPHAFGEASYVSPNMARVPQLQIDGQGRGPKQDPLVQWYASNDGPWVPKVIPDVAPAERIQATQAGNRNLVSYGNQYRQPNPSEAGSVQFGVPNSDSGYGTRRSVGNTSVFSADVAERDQDCQSLAGHLDNFQPFQGLNEILPGRDSRISDSWAPRPISIGSDSSGLICQTCQKPVKTQSELKKHNLRHTKPFKCSVDMCPRKDGFSTINDLDRHTRSKHPGATPESASTKTYHCYVPGCKSRGKTWPRLDNFRSHLKRVHHHNMTTEEIEDMIRRAESNESAMLNADQKHVPIEPPSQTPWRPASPAVHENKLEPHLEPVHPDRVDSPRPVPPREPQMDKLVTEPVPQEERNPQPDIQRPITIQLPEISPTRTKTPVGKFSVLAPAGQANSVINAADNAKPNSSPKASSVPAKAARQNDGAISDNLTEVIRAVLSGASIQDPHGQGTNRASLPNGRTPLGSSDILSGQTDHIKTADSPCSETDSIESRESKQAEEIKEIIKTIRNLGYIVQKETTQPTRQNSGSISGNRSSNIVSCNRCNKFQGRPCELKKHMKRHDKPYGCTFLECGKSFGSKNDWKRHENSQHFQLEAWRCDKQLPKGGACSKLCYRRQNFEEHLKQEHQIPDDADALTDALEGCRIGRSCDARFWCGFCVKLVDLKEKGLAAWTERFDHIDDHFMGRKSFSKQNILQWVPVDGSAKLEGDSGSRPDMSRGKGASDDQSSPTSGSPSGSCSSDAGGSAGCSPDATTVEASGATNTKRRHSDGDDGSRPKKQPRTATPKEVTIFCCQCHIGHNLRFNEYCSICPDGHSFCDRCSREHPD